MLKYDDERDHLDVAWDGALTSRMNVRYYSQKLQGVERWDFAARLFSGLVGAAGVAVWLSDKVPELAAGMVALSAVVSVVSASLQVGERIRSYTFLRTRYLGHEQEFTRLHEADGGKGAVAAEVLRYNQTEQLEAGMTGAPDRSALARCQDMVLAEIGADQAMQQKLAQPA